MRCCISLINGGISKSFKVFLDLVGVYGPLVGRRSELLRLGLAEFRALGFTVGKCVTGRCPKRDFARSGADGCHGILGEQVPVRGTAEGAPWLRLSFLPRRLAAWFCRSSDRLEFFFGFCLDLPVGRLGRLEGWL